MSSGGAAPAVYIDMHLTYCSRLDRRSDCRPPTETCSLVSYRRDLSELGARHLGITSRGDVALEPNTCKSWCTCLFRISEGSEDIWCRARQSSKSFLRPALKRTCRFKMIRLKVRYSVQRGPYNLQEYKTAMRRLGHPRVLSNCQIVRSTYIAP
jgi:hypothetical protein